MYLKKLLVTFHDLQWPRRHEEGSLVAIFQFRVSRLPVTRYLRVFSMFLFFLSKRDVFQFSPIGKSERSQNWSDLRSQIAKFWDIQFIDTTTCINCWKFQGNRSVGVALTRIQTFYEVSREDTWRNLVAWHWVTWVWNYHNICEKCMNRCAWNGGDITPQFFDNLEKLQRVSIASIRAMVKCNNQ